MKQFAVATLLTTATAAAAPPPDSAPASPPAPVAEAKPRALPRSVHAQKPPEEYMPNPMLLVLAGGALGAGGLFAGGYLGYKIECASGCGGEFGGIGGLVLGAGIGLTAAATTGIMLTGIDGEHHSSVGLTWLGTVIGGAAGAVAASKAGSDLAGSTILLATGTALGGTLLYYAARSKDRPAPAIRVVPFSDGGSVGVALVGNTP